MQNKLTVLGIAFVGTMFALALVLIVGALFVFNVQPSGEGVIVVLPSVEFSGEGRHERVRGSGDIVTEDVPVSDFDRVALDGIGDVIITQQETESLSIETDDNILPYIETKVRNGTLIISLTSEARNKNLDPTMIEISVGMQEVAGLSIGGAGDIFASSLDVDRLQLDVNGAGKINVGELDATELSVGFNGAGSVEVDALNAEESSVSINGAGDVSLTGQVERQEIAVNGAGDYHADSLKSQTCNVEVNGAGSVTVWATESLDVRIGGIGNVSYYGNPRLDTSLYGIGRLFSLGER
ncbi:MAG: DUF2807 domain-containing protein [Chloroflexi bacterium]|nr:DUF2807 domain-containing protein [Chloroflexota bacterium]